MARFKSKLTLAVAATTLATLAFADATYGTYRVEGVTSASPEHPNNFVLPIWNQSISNDTFSVYASESLQAVVYLVDSNSNVVAQTSQAKNCFDATGSVMAIEQNEKLVCHYQFDVNNLAAGYHHLVVSSNSANNGSVFEASGGNFHQPVRLKHHALISRAALDNKNLQQFETLELEYQLDHSGPVSISLDRSARQNSKVDLKIFNDKGGVVFDRSGGGEDTTVNFEHLQAGTYRFEIDIFDAFTPYENHPAEHDGFVINFSEGRLTQKVNFQAQVVGVGSNHLLNDTFVADDIIEGYYKIDLAEQSKTAFLSESLYNVKGDRSLGEITFTAPAALAGETSNSFEIFNTHSPVPDFFLTGKNDSAEQTLAQGPFSNELKLKFSKIYMHDNVNPGLYPITQPHIENWKDSTFINIETVSCDQSETRFCDVKAETLHANIIGLGYHKLPARFSPQTICYEQGEWPTGPVYTNTQFGGKGEMTLLAQGYTSRVFCNIPDNGKEIKSISIKGSESLGFIESPWASPTAHWEGNGCKVLLNNNQALNINQTLTQKSIRDFNVKDVPQIKSGDGDASQFIYDLNTNNLAARQANISCHLDVGVPYVLNDILVEYADEVPSDIESNWTNSGGRSATAAGNVEFKFSINTTQTVKIDLTSNADTYLYLLDSAKNLVTYNDDGGVGYNSLINRNLSAGDYYLVAATYRTNQNADFNLALKGDDITSFEKVKTLK